MVVQKSSPTWSDVKAKLADFDRASLQGLVKDLYVASKDNQSFLHARFGLGADVLNPYKARIHRWLWPDLRKNEEVSASKAKKAIADYKKAIGHPEGLAELMVFYCERAADFGIRLNGLRRRSGGSPPAARRGQGTNQCEAHRIPPASAGDEVLSSWSAASRCPSMYAPRWRCVLRRELQS